MSIIQAYKSDSDNKIFENKDDYLKHLKRLAKQKLFSKTTNYLEKKNIKFNENLKKIKCTEELIGFVLENQSLLIKNGIYDNFKSYKLSVRLDPLINPKNYKISNLKLTPLVWSNEVSTSHCRPTNQRTTIYSNLDSQPGWLTNIYISFDNSEKTKGVHICPNILKRTPLNTGSGGSSDGINYNYNLKLFAIDFPEMIMPFLIQQLNNNVDLDYFEVKEQINVIKNIIPHKYNINDPELLILTDLLMINHKNIATDILNELLQIDIHQKNTSEIKKIKI